MLITVLEFHWFALLFSMILGKEDSEASEQRAKFSYLTAIPARGMTLSLER